MMKSILPRIQKVDELIVYTWMSLKHVESVRLSDFGKHAREKWL